MPISQTASLFQLIKSLSKAEKRNFKLYAKRNQGADTLKFIDLFDIIDKQKEEDDQLFFSKLNGLKKTQYANLKRHLYSQILVSLRLIHKTKRTNIQVREYIDFAYILYGKGLYIQALKILQIAKREAIKHHLNYTHLTILEFEKLIESRHITRSGQLKAQELAYEAETLQKSISDIVFLSNLRTEIHGRYIRDGHVEDESERLQLEKDFLPKLRAKNALNLGLIEKIYLYQSYVWYACTKMDFHACLEYALKWVQLFEDNRELIIRDVDLYMRGYHYLLTAAYHIKNLKRLEKYLDHLEGFRKSNYKKFNKNSQIISFLYVHTGRLNRIILNGQFEKGLEVIPRTLRRINRYRNKLDDHRILVFYFKIAYLYFGAGKYKLTIKYLHHIINNEMNLREDLQTYARLMYLMCQYEQEDYESIQYLIKTYQTFFAKIKKHNPLQINALQLFVKLTKTVDYEHREIMKEYLTIFEALQKDFFQQTSFNYLDINSWLKSKITKTSLGDVINNK